MRTVETYRGYDIVETDWTTTVRVGVDREDVRPVFVIMGLKERPSSPFLTSVPECREYVDSELAGREEMRRLKSARWRAVVRHRGNSLAVTVPAQIARDMGLEDGDEVVVEVSME